MKATEILKEVEEQDIGRYDPNEDDLSVRQLDNTRKPKLTLRHLNRLKKIRATKQVEQKKKEDLLTLMYGSKGGDDGGDAGF